MSKVEVVSTTLVKAPPLPSATSNQEEQTSSKKLNLTSSDVRFILLGSIQKGLLFPKPTTTTSSLTLIQHLKTSFSQTLRFFFPLSGRLSTIQHQDDDDNNKNTISFFIDCNNAGAQFVHAIAQNVSVSDILEPVFVPSVVHLFFPLTQINNYDGVSNPLLGVQITELSDGIFIGCTMNHAVVDGTTFWNFMNSWSEISRGNNISKLPVFENWFRNCSIRLPVSIIKKSSDKFIPPLLKERVFHFSNENVGALKAKANFEVGNGNCAVVISSLQSVLAHIWRGVIRNRRSEPDQEAKLMLLIGYRRRLLKPEVPDGYFGNAVEGGFIELKAREVIEKGLGFVALEINKMVSDYTEEKVRKNIDSWIKDPKIPTMSAITGDVLGTSSSPRFDVYGNDFGWGKAKAVRSGPGNKFDGKVTVFPGLEQGSIDIEICVSPEVLEAMENDSEFMDALSV